MLHRLPDTAQREPPMTSADRPLYAAPGRRHLSIFPSAKLYHGQKTPHAGLADVDSEPAHFRRLLDFPRINPVSAAQVPDRGNAAPPFKNAPDEIEAFAAEEEGSHKSFASKRITEKAAKAIPFCAW